MFLKTGSLPSIFTSPTSSPWICVACRSKFQIQLRKASSNTLPVKASHPPKEYEAKKKPLTTNKTSTASPLPPLNFLIGSNQPPKAGQNPAKDLRPWSERWDAYWAREAHDERKRKIVAELSRAHYQDWHRMRRRRGKTFTAPDQPFQAHVAKYFPNFQGYTLADTWSYVDTTKVLLGKVSVVSFVRENWAREQADSFVGKAENPELARLIEMHKDDVGLQKVLITYEGEFLKRIIVYLFLWYARRKSDAENGKEMRARSLVVTRGVDREFFENNLGVTNLRVGFVYLVDALCRIRWVGNGDASEEERASLVRVLKRLIQERKSALEKRSTPLTKKPVERRDNGPKPLSAMMV